MEDIIPLIMCVFVFALTTMLLLSFLGSHSVRSSLLHSYDSAVMRCLYLSQGMDAVNGSSAIAVSMPVEDGKVVCRG
jgi:hypothetical protein